MTSFVSRFVRNLDSKPKMVTNNFEFLLRCTREYSNVKKAKPSFGLLFDIDGVIVRDKKVLPYAPECFQKLVDLKGTFRIPTVFVTNAGNATRCEKAQQLSSWLGLEITEEQVVMAHSPLRMFQQYHNKRVLVSGQGPVAEIAKNLGFKKVITIDEMRQTFPMLDTVDHKRRKPVVFFSDESISSVEEETSQKV